MAMQNTLKENREAIDKALAQNNKALTATIIQGKDALGASILISQEDRRAWVGVVGVATIGATADAGSFAIGSVHIILRNSGKTPALKMSGNCCYVQSRPWRDPIPDYDKAVAEGEELRRKLDTEHHKRLEEFAKEHPEMASRLIEDEKNRQTEISSTEK
jgi:hypothetical protein